MHQPRDFGPDDQEVVRYLLGVLPEEERQRFDEASIVDDEMAVRVRSVENDLVDAYVSRTLAGETLARFESFYLASPRRRQRVKSAERFLGAVDRVPVRGAATAAPAASGRAAPWSRFAWLAAAAAFLLVACGVLLVEDLRLREGLSQARRAGVAGERRSQTLARQLDEGRAENAVAAKALEEAHAALAARGQASSARG